MPDRLELDFEVTRDDWIAANQTLVSISPHWDAAAKVYRRKLYRQMLWMGPIIILVATLGIGGMSSTRCMYWEGALIGTLFVGLMTFGLARIDEVGKAKRVAMERVRRMDLGDHVGPMKLSIDEAGVIIHAPKRRLELSWTLVTVHDVGDYILLTHGNPDGTIVPKRAFPTPNLAAEFVAQSHNWWQSGQLPATERITRYLKDRDAECPGCRYNLRGIASDICPECGVKLTLEQLLRARQP